MRELVDEEHELVVSTALGPPPQCPPEHPLNKVHWRSLDLGSPEEIQGLVDEVRPNAVYHLAGQASVGQSLEKPLATWDTNATGTLRLLVALSALGSPVRFLLASSAEVYGAVAADKQPIDELTPVRPLTPYGASKAAAELVCFQTASAGAMEVVVARSFNHIGPGQDARFVLPSVALQLEAIRRGEREPSIDVGNLDVQRDFLDVRDAVRGYVTLMKAGRSGEAYNISSGKAMTLFAVLNRLVELSGTGAELVVNPDRVRSLDIPLLVGDAGKLTSLGWKPTFALETTLADLLAEARQRA